MERYKINVTISARGKNKLEIIGPTNFPTTIFKQRDLLSSFLLKSNNFSLSIILGVTVGIVLIKNTWVEPKAKTKRSKYLKLMSVLVAAKLMRHKRIILIMDDILKTRIGEYLSIIYPLNTEIRSQGRLKAETNNDP